MRNPLELLNRAPVAYTGVRSGLGSIFGGFGVGNKNREMQMMGANSTLFAIVNRTSTATASVDWHLHRMKRGATCTQCECEGVEYVEKHPALTVLNQPNQFFTRQELVEATQQHVDLTGEGWLVISRRPDVPGVPFELWNMRPDRVEVVTSPTKYILGYIYHGPSGEEVPLDRRDVMSIRMPNPLDPYRGMGPVQSIMNNLDSSRYSTEWNRNFFLNGALPGGIIKVARRMQDEEWRQFQQRWRESHQGVGNAHRVGILEGDSEWVDVKFSQKDMQFVELENLNKDTIRQAFGVSKFVLGDVDDVNRAQGDASRALFAEETTVPRLDRWKGMLNNDFLPLFPGYDPNLSFVYSSPVPEDRDADRADKSARVADYVALVNVGVEPSEAARIAGVPPMRHVATPTPAPTTPGTEAA